MTTIERMLFDLAGRPTSMVDYLDASTYDELIEIDFSHGTFRNIAHIEGKFFVPVLEGEFRDLYLYSGSHMVHPEDQQAHDELMNSDNIFKRLRESEVPGIVSSEIRYRLQNGGYHWTREIVIGGEEHGLKPGTVRVYIFDIQSQKDRELMTVDESGIGGSNYRDELTGLRREKEFTDTVSSHLAAGTYDGWCMVDLDIDQFNLFNEWYGRKAGDFVLAKIGAYLARREDEEGLVAGYLGQDDFRVFMPYSASAINALHDDVLRVIADYGASITFSPMLGVCLVEDDISVYELMDRATLASKTAKSDIKHHICLFEPEMHERTDAEYRLLKDFEQGIANDEFFFVLQPQCRISTSHVIGAEALARWQRADGTVMMPNQFLPVLEKFGFITDLDCHIWDKVCAYQRSWIDDGNDPVPISVNVSRQDIYEFDVPGYFDSLLAQYKLPASLIKIEITESAYVDDSDRVGQTVRRLRDSGFMVFMDDFGSGYSSLNTLDSLSVDAIKLDMCFMHMSDDGKRKSIRIIESMVNMAKMLDLSIIAEGVEEKEQAEFLHGIGCRYVQGFYFHHPMLPEEFEKLISGGENIDEEGFKLKPNEEFRTREILDQTVYSDTMLNNILGALGIYSWHGQDVDIIRFNEQFYEEVGIPNLQDHLARNQSYVDEKDLVRFYNLLCDAMEDELNGASDVIRYRKLDGTPFDMFMHFYFLGEIEGSKRFFGSVHNITQLTELLDQRSLISHVTDKCISFIRQQKVGWSFTVSVCGIQNALGLTREELQRELDDGSFFTRLDPKDAAYFSHIMSEGNAPKEDFEMPLEITTAQNTKVTMTFQCFCVKEAKTTYSHVLVLF